MLEQTLRDWERQIRKAEFQREFQIGFQQGFRIGLQEGQIQGMQKLILSILRHGFGPVPQVVRRQVKEISSTRELQRLSRRILTADSLEQTGLV